MKWYEKLEYDFFCDHFSDIRKFLVTKFKEEVKTSEAYKSVCMKLIRPAMSWVLSKVDPFMSAENIFCVSGHV